MNAASQEKESESAVTEPFKAISDYREALVSTYQQHEKAMVSQPSTIFQSVEWDILFTLDLMIKKMEQYCLVLSYLQNQTDAKAKQALRQLLPDSDTANITEFISQLNDAMQQSAIDIMNARAAASNTFDTLLSAVMFFASLMPVLTLPLILFTALPMLAVIIPAFVVSFIGFMSHEFKLSSSLETYKTAVATKNALSCSADTTISVLPKADAVSTEQALAGMSVSKTVKSSQYQHSFFDNSNASQRLRSEVSKAYKHLRSSIDTESLANNTEYGRYPRLG